MITDLLFEAATYFANMSNPAALDNSEAALEEVRKFLGVEEKILAVPKAMEELKALVFTELDPTGRFQNHAMMAGLILARSGWPSSASTLLSAARQPDPWCSVQARLNLGWLAPTEESVNLLLGEIRRPKKEDPTEIPELILVDTLIRQRAPAILPTILSYIEGEESEANRAAILNSLVDLWPEQGLEVAKNMPKEKPSVLPLTNLGLQAVFLSDEAYRELLNYRASGDDVDATVLRWLGRIPCPESLPRLLQGLNHPSIVVRCDVLIGLALLGVKDSYEAVLQALLDPAKEVADQAMALLFELFDEDLAELKQQ